MYTERRRTAAATGMDFGFDLGAEAAVAARRAAGVRLCGRARQRCNPCTHPYRRRHYYPHTAADHRRHRRLSPVRVSACVCGAHVGASRRDRLAAPRSPGENPRILRSNAHALGSRAPPRHTYRDGDAFRIPVTGAPAPRRRRLTALARSRTHKRTYTHTRAYT